jgi:hypothetical protein
VEVDKVGRTLGEPLTAAEQVREAQLAEPLVLDGQARQLPVAARAGQAVLQGHLDVGVLEGIELLGDDRQPRGVLAEVSRDAVQERAVDRYWTRGAAAGWGRASQLAPNRI